jgi:hypothetical protein
MKPSPHTLAFLAAFATPAALAALLAFALAGCASSPPDSLLGAPPSVDVASPLRGIPDPGADPAVVLLDLGGQGLCVGALLASDLVLTARRCVSVVAGDTTCPAAGPQVSGGMDLETIRVLVGDDVSSAVERARGRAMLVPDGDVLCGADVALLLLDATIDEVAPLVVQATGAAAGDRVRTVGFASGRKIVRDHVAVTAVSSRELSLAEAPCDGVAGGPAVDESSGQVVGVLSRSAPGCTADGAYDVDTRTDAFSSMVNSALAQATQSHAAHQSREKKGPVDVGASCARGADCAAGTCVAYVDAQYCSRPCDAHDKCPSDYRCMASRQGPMSCVAE